jgi:DNA-binding NtrC family response regulator
VSRILVIDDEPAIGWSLRELFRDGGHDAVVAADPEAALAACRQAVPDVILLDVRLGAQDGLAALPGLRAAAGDVPVIVMTAFGDLDTAVRAVRAGAYDYLVKPFELARVAEVVERALAERGDTSAAAAPADEARPREPARLVGTSPAMQEVFKQIALVAAGDLPVLVTGETGTGKELVARAIHAHGRRHDRPLVVTNVAALAPGVVESELFGHARGAFSGAAADRPGLFEMADGGTLFLDEIGEAPATVQAKLLRALEAGEVMRVGESVPRQVDVRVVAATNRDLAAALRGGTFREDLYHRLCVFPIALPSLAERLDDLEPLVRHFLARHAAGRAVPAVAPEFLAAIRGRPWPGNVRELEHAVEYAAVIARGGTLRPEHLPRAAGPGPSDAGAAGDAAASVTAAVKAWSAAARAAAGERDPDLHARAVALVEEALVRETIAHTGGNRTAAARLLGLDRATLRAKLRALGIDE